ncbi:hypothetical protein V6N11_037877 [Hibiscus sabdariffa]|uniref:Uncharacterized protein n=1 Tax=Hibiscus sabdariffa TaxID=183260 RepID=A0ABR2A6C8_9ROSI
MASSWKKTRGKQKIDMNIIEIEDEKLVTFSKHRSGTAGRGRAYKGQWHWPESGYYLGQSTATKISAHHRSSGTSEWLLFGPIYGDEDFCPSQSNLLPKLKNVVSVYIEEEKLIFGGRAYREQWHWPESGYYSGQSTATKISAHHSLTYCRS